MEGAVLTFVQKKLLMVSQSRNVPCAITNHSINPEQCICQFCKTVRKVERLEYFIDGPYDLSPRIAAPMKTTPVTFPESSPSRTLSHSIQHADIPGLNGSTTRTIQDGNLSCTFGSVSSVGFLAETALVGPPAGKRKRTLSSGSSQVWYEDPLNGELNEDSGTWDELLGLKSVIVVFFKKVGKQRMFDQTR